MDKINQVKTKQRTLVQALCLTCLFSFAQANEPPEIRIRGGDDPRINTTSPYSLFFDPLKNNVKLERQRIEYDLSKESTLYLGPYSLDDTSVTLEMTREIGEFYDFDFGLEFTRRLGSIYVISFKWPIDFVPNGTIEILDDRARSLWRRKVTEADISEWKKILEEQTNRSLFEKNRSELEKKLREEKSPAVLQKIKEKLQLASPQKLSAVHYHSQFGLAHKGFFEIPITQINGPFRYCVSLDRDESRLAVCSKRYQFIRQSGRYKLMSVSKEVPARVLINDKPVTLKGTAIFLENDVPIKFAALLKGGTYFEFVSHPKEIRLVDMVKDVERNHISIIGYGDAPMGEIEESFYADVVHWGFLNFMPTIGDLRKFWRGRIYDNARYLYLRGEGGAPFRQTFEFENLPTTRARVVLSEKTTKSTYGSHVWVKGTVNPEIQVSADGTEVVRESPTEFSWKFRAPVSGVYNKDTLNIHENGKKWKAEYEIYRGNPAELGVRLSGVLTSELTLVLLGEIAGQYWFENLFGWQNYRFGHQRWGVAAKYFEAFIGTDESLKKLAAGTLDLKYRFTPGIWGRDPTVGIMASALNFDYGFKDELGEVNYSVPVVGGGAFWARSMPKIFDDLFNILPFMRYPKWVDWEFIYYPLALRDLQKSNFMFAMNFHGTIQWRPNFYGEAGFGLKNYSFQDARSTDVDKQLAPTIFVAYGTVGLGFNF